MIFRIYIFTDKRCYSTLFGGPSQPEPYDTRGGIQAAANMALDSDSTINPNQYENDNVSPVTLFSCNVLIGLPQNWKSHVRWTGPQILRQLPEISLICAGMGTSGQIFNRIAHITIC